ncbi:MAG TPA: serine/threonine-protein kinase [Holophagaceae bacterium]|nr:serine/threonine-protein kinase [Holophagaceae bacterium]
MPTEPQSIGRYRVIRLLGEGGMGAVYLCQDPLLKRQVAVKTVLAGRSDSAEMLERFQRESEISAQLNFPHIVTVFDVGNDPEIGPFMTMEFVDGSSLASLIQSGNVSPAGVVDLLAQAGQALDAAARGGVVHRDVKPENMLVSKDGFLKLTDFGVAREVTSQTLTTTGMLVGTPTHMAPELLSGDKASATSDRYALTVTAFQLLFKGALPHKGSTIHALLTHILYSNPEMPPDMPGPVARVFLKALHKEPARRYPSTQAFLEDLAEAYGIEAPAPAKTGDRYGSSHPSQDDMTTQDIPSPSPAHAPDDPPTKGGGARLTGPPDALLKGGADAYVGPSPDEYLRRLNLGLVAPSAYTSNSRVRLIPLPQQKPQTHTRALTMILLLVAALAGWNYLHTRSVRAAEAAAGLTGPAPKFIRVQTDPPGAAVLVGGDKVGTTPMNDLYVPAFATDLVIQKEGYKPWHGQVGPDTDLPSTIRLVPAD